MDYEKLMERFKNTFAKNGVTEELAGPFFGKADEEEIKYMTDLYSTFSYQSAVYLDGELETLKNYTMPKSVVDFYSMYEPKNDPMTNAGIRLCDLRTFMEENSCDGGGGVLIKYGVFTIAVTIGGELVCIDLNNMVNDEPRVVIFNNWECCDVDGINSYEDIQKIEHLVSESFSEFLWKYSGDEYDEFEDTFLSDDDD